MIHCSKLNIRIAVIYKNDFDSFHTSLCSGLGWAQQLWDEHFLVENLWLSNFFWNFKNLLYFLKLFSIFFYLHFFIFFFLFFLSLLPRHTRGTPEFILIRCDLSNACSLLLPNCIFCAGNDAKLIRCVLGVTLNSSIVVQGMTLNCDRACAFGSVDEAVSGGKPLAGKSVDG